MDSARSFPGGLPERGSARRVARSGKKASPRGGQAARLCGGPRRRRALSSITSIRWAAGSQNARLNTTMVMGTRKSKSMPVMSPSAWRKEIMNGIVIVTMFDIASTVAAYGTTPINGIDSNP